MSSKKSIFHDIKFFSLPLYVRILIFAGLGFLFGVIFGKDPIIFNIRNEDLSVAGSLVIKLIKAFASPLIFFAVVETFVHTQVRLKEALHLFLGCSFNVLVAMGIGLWILNIFEPGKLWHGKIDLVLSSLNVSAADSVKLIEKSHAAVGALNPVAAMLQQFPQSFVQPFVENEILSVVILAIITGIALRAVKAKGAEDPQQIALATKIDGFFSAGMTLFMSALQIIVEFMPFAVFCVIAGAVGKSGFAVFHILWVFLATLMAGLAVHSVIFYPLAAWVLGGINPIRFLRGAADPAITALSCNSSLATVPVTLNALKKLGVSEKSARLSACVATNFNNDGITLYEAMAALFIAQAMGINWTIHQQIMVILTSILASLGSAGLPEAGLILLPLVLTQAGLPEAMVAMVIPLILPVDWIIARMRSAVNTLNDMLIAIYCDRWSKS